MARKKKSDIKHPERSHPLLTAEEARQRELQRQRDKRARRRQERAAACLRVGSPAPNPLDEDDNSMVASTVEREWLT